MPAAQNVLADAFSFMDGENTISLLNTEIDAFIEFPDPQMLALPLFALLRHYQLQDAELQAARQAHTNKYPFMHIGRFQLIFYIKEPNAPW